MLHWAIEIKKVSTMGYFSREILIHRHWRQEVPLSYWFELFGNLYELKSRIRFWEDYNNVERIYRVCDRFSSNFAKTFKE